MPHLSAEATVILRPPTVTGLPAHPEFKKPKISFLTGKWSPVLTSLPLSRYQRSPPRNPEFQLRIGPEFGTYAATETWLDPDNESEPPEAKTQPRTSTVEGEVLDASGSRLEYEASRFKDDTGRPWEVVAWGKQGQDHALLTLNRFGYLCDPHGIARGEWRNSYVVVYYEARGQEEAGVEVWDSSASAKLSSDTFEKIRTAIRESENAEFAKIGDSMVEVPIL